MTTAVAWMAPVCALIGICMAGYLGSWVLKQDPGPDKMNNISLKIQQGAKAFLMSEYKLLVIFMVIVAIVMAVALSPITALAFVTGGVMSAAAGYVGMHVATRANTRTAHAAEESVAKALNISFKSGLTMGLCVASFALLGLSLWLIAMVFGMAAGVDINAELAGLMHTNIGMVEGFATGASAVALFARVGGGIYTKAADVGADLVGKVEAGIPEDDPRNPATIADNVGDNVGDVAGMGADLFESYTGAILAPTILAATFGALGGYFATGDLVWALVTPVIIAGCGIITSIIGLFAVRAKEGAALHKALNRGTYVAAGIEIVVIFCLFYAWSTLVRRRAAAVAVRLGAVRPGGGPRHRQDHRVLLLRQVQAGAQDRRRGRHRRRHGHHRGHRHGHALHHRPHRAGGAGHHRRVHVRQPGLPAGFGRGRHRRGPVRRGPGRHGHAVQHRHHHRRGRLRPRGRQRGRHRRDERAWPAEVRERTDALDAVGNTTAAIGQGLRHRRPPRLTAIWRCSSPTSRPPGAPMPFRTSS